MTIVGLHHVQLAMPNGEEAKAIAFYEELLGLPHVEKPLHLRARGGCWFDQHDSSTLIGLIQPELRCSR
jgi:catechol 2,3-dioxygenase-like lactoylglutathione lyase family enzyme